MQIEEVSARRSGADGFDFSAQKRLQGTYSCEMIADTNNGVGDPIDEEHQACIIQVQSL